jgi:hypothetical protein
MNKKTNRKVLGIAAAIGVVALMALPAQGASLGTLNAKFTSKDPNSQTYAGGLFTFQTQTGGTFTQQLVGGTAGTFVAFCLELNEFITLNETVPYDVRPLAEAPRDAGGYAPLANGMLSTKADALARLVTVALGGSLANAIAPTADVVDRIAFQMAVWEIVYEQNATFSVTGGTIGIGFGPATNNLGGGIPTYGDGTAASRANGWLAGLYASGVTPALNLVGLTNLDRQDMMAQVVPIPAAAWLLGSGLLGLLGISRRRRAGAA